MKRICSAIIMAILALFFQNALCSEAATHKESLQKAQAILDNASVNVINSKFYPSYHIAPPANFMNSPSGFVYFNNQYHLFFTHNPYSVKDENMHWGHYISSDLIHWSEMPVALAPSESYDKDGILSGSAIVDEGMLYLLYTGNVVNKTEEKTERHQTQNLAMSKDGINFAKSANNAVIKMAPHYSYLEFSSHDFRDPFVWKQSDRYYALVGTQYEKTKDGAVLLFKSKDLRNWVCINITAIGSKSEMGYMWESPGFLHIGSDDVLFISPQGIKPHGKQFLNKYQSGWFVGNLDYNTGKFKQKGPFGLFDYGFDFYAPRVVKTQDNRHVLIGLLGMSGSKLTESEDGWAGMMSIPRELKILNGKVSTVPLPELKALREHTVAYKDQKVSTAREFPSINGEVFELETEADLTNAKTFSISIRTSPSQETILSYDKDSKLLKLNRDKSGRDLNGEREVVVPLNNNLLKLHIFADKSSVEIFANDGQVVMSSRIYPDKHSTGIKFSAVGEVKLNYLNFYKLKSIYND